MIFETGYLSDTERALVIEDMIADLALESGKHVDIIINEISRHYEVDQKVVTDLLKSVDSVFINETNRIVGYIDGQPIKRTTYHMSCKRIFEKIVKGFKRNELFDIGDQDHITFITEATYSYLKNKSDETPALEV